MNTSSESALPALNSTQVTENLLHSEVTADEKVPSGQEPTAQPSTEGTPLIDSTGDDTATATIWSSVANMTNNVLGAGLVALPYSISQVHISLVFKWSVHSFLESFCLF